VLLKTGLRTTKSSSKQLEKEILHFFELFSNPVSFLLLDEFFLYPLYNSRINRGKKFRVGDAKKILIGNG
jgi:hypothetical protein